METPGGAIVADGTAAFTVTAAGASGGAFVVAVRDSLAEYGGFTVDADDRDLLARLDERIDWLTDDRPHRLPGVASRSVRLPTPVRQLAAPRRARREIQPP